MKHLAITLIASIFASLSISTAFASEQECKKLKNENDVIYAAKGFCFKDPEAKAKFNDNCFTTKPKFSPKEQEKLDEIKARQKELNCK